MPELPDLQVFSTNLDKHLKGKKVEQVVMPVAEKSNVSSAALNKTLRGQTVQHVYRDGKQLRIEFSGKDILGLHLMLNGNLHLFDKKNEQKNTIIEILFDDNSGLAMTDWQRLAAATLNPEPVDAPDALSDDVDTDFLKEKLQTKKNVKTVLMDQKIIRGIGNAYADEILWDARISPASVSNKIPDDAIKALAKSIKKVLKDAEKNIRKTHPDIIAGEVRDFLLIHNSEKKKSPDGAEIKNTRLNSRITYYTEEQELYQ